MKNMNVFHAPDSVPGVPEETPGPPFMKVIVQLRICALETELWFRNFSKQIKKCGNGDSDDTDSVKWHNGSILSVTLIFSLLMGSVASLRLISLFVKIKYAEKTAEIGAEDFDFFFDWVFL